MLSRAMPGVSLVCFATLAMTEGLKRHQRGGDPAILGAEHAPGARGGAAVHRLDADTARLDRSDEGGRRAQQAGARPDQDELGRRADGL